MDAFEHLIVALTCSHLPHTNNTFGCDSQKPIDFNVSTFIASFALLEQNACPVSRDATSGVIHPPSVANTSLWPATYLAESLAPGASIGHEDVTVFRNGTRVRVLSRECIGCGCDGH